MDASTRLNLLLNGVKIPKGELTPNDWYELATALVLDCSPRFKYLTGLKRIREHGEDWKFEVGDGSNKIPIEIMGNEFLPADRFLHITELSSRVHLMNLNPQRSQVKREHLLLSESRDWVRAYICYELTPHSSSYWKVWLNRFKKEDAREWFGKTIKVPRTPDHNLDKEVCGLVVCERLVQIMGWTIADKRRALEGLDSSMVKMSARMARVVA